MDLFEDIRMKSLCIISYFQESIQSVIMKTWIDKI